MSTQDTRTSDGGSEGSRTIATADEAISTLATRGRDGTLATLVGGAMLARELKTSRKSRGRAVLMALPWVALVAVGVRQQRAKREADGVETGEDARRDEEGDKKVSDEAHAETHRDIGAGRDADESASVFQSESEPNPRGMTDRADAQDDEGGDIDFVEGKDPQTHRGTHLEDEAAHDTRLHPDDDSRTEVDLSKSAMADEASEAVGPHPEQAYPAKEGTDPEPTSANAPERVGEGAVAPTGPESGEETGDGEGESEATDDDSGRTDGAAESESESDSEDDTDGA